MTKDGSVYIMINKLKTTLYIDVTADLQLRICQHKEHYFQNNFTENTILNIAFTMKTFILLKKQY